MANSHFLLLVLLLCVFSVSADVFVSLDCGSSEAYTDLETSIAWSGDDDYLANGESYVVQSNSSISHVMDTLRVFTSRKKNCYLIDEIEQGGKVLIRASFYYGNYDGKSNPPSFALQFDGNHWATVTTMSDQLVYYETIYVVKGNYLSVCLAQTVDDQFPFISALEVRGLDSTMYSHVDDNHALFLRRRVAFGSNKTIRYLSKFNLSGSLPDFSSMDALETIDLSDNNLDGPIPDFLGTLPNLKELNLADNQFSGPIPASLSNKNGLTLNTSGNSDLYSASDESCQNNNSSSPGNDQPATTSAKNNKNKKKKNNLPIILGTTIPAFFLVWAIVGIFAILHYKNKRAATSVVNPGQTSGGNTPNVNVQMADKFGKDQEDVAHHENSTNV